jgi:putative transposase
MACLHRANRSIQHCMAVDTDNSIYAGYIHFNPVKHGYVRSAQDWPHSSFHRLVAQGQYPAGWAAAAEVRGCDSE